MADSTTKCNGNPSGRWMGWGSILEALPPSKVCQACATAISSRKNDTKSLRFAMPVGLSEPSPASWAGVRSHLRKRKTDAGIHQWYRRTYGTHPDTTAICVQLPPNLPHCFQQRYIHARQPRHNPKAFRVPDPVLVQSLASQFPFSPSRQPQTCFQSLTSHCPQQKPFAPRYMTHTTPLF